MDCGTVSDSAKVQLTRAVGVAIVKNGSMYPTMELLLRHSIQVSLSQTPGRASCKSPGSRFNGVVLTPFALQSVDAPHYQPSTSGCEARRATGDSGIFCFTRERLSSTWTLVKTDGKRLSAD